MTDIEQFNQLLAGELLSGFPGYAPPFHILQEGNSIALMDASGQMLCGVPGTDPAALAARIVHNLTTPREEMFNEVTEAARAMGKKKSAKKALSSAANLEANRYRGGRQSTAVCKCGGPPHKSRCPVGRREKNKLK